jgi:hypothetical protein
MYKLFGANMDNLMDELNDALAAWAFKKARFFGLLCTR